ncbi:aminoglycoside phosphotransferase family protein [Vibrio sp. WXL210]|uniref:aminoglycoside phosphotransferase family protein n=1 Tax=Vibrio sp. WXL210 TaxID=3450709 RepID=UPI003EC6359D
MTSCYQNFLTPIGLQAISDAELIQPLWSGYGELVRQRVAGESSSVVIKHVKLPEERVHPRGWNNPRSHQRKLRSYQVESNWYQHYCQDIDPRCPTPRSLRTFSTRSEWLMIMEDLAVKGFSVTSSTQSTEPQQSACLYWLANFHAKYIHHHPNQLWPSGTYWHLATRPDELASLADSPLKRAAPALDSCLAHAPFPTLVHGDAKLANFCFTPDGTRAAAIDFQYVGKGCAMKDVALFMSSAVPPEQCASQEQPLLDSYFAHLRDAIRHYQPDLYPDAVEQAWRPLFAIAWADFQRFIKGWSPEHWKINPYTEELTRRALQQLEAYQDDN